MKTRSLTSDQYDQSNFRSKPNNNNNDDEYDEYYDKFHKDNDHTTMNNNEIDNYNNNDHHDDNKNNKNYDTTTTDAPGTIKFNWRSKVDWERYDDKSVWILDDGSDLSYAADLHFNRAKETIADRPIVIRRSFGLDMAVPQCDDRHAHQTDNSISPQRLLEYISRQVGPRRIVQVFDCSSQNAATTQLGHFATWFSQSRPNKIALKLTNEAKQRHRKHKRHHHHPTSSNNNRDHYANDVYDDVDDEFDDGHKTTSSPCDIFNLISLELSGTRLNDEIYGPKIVRQLDWIDLAWPIHKRKIKFDSNGNVFDQQFPKIQKYVLASIAGCYTDFHIDMNGSSVWYYLHTGSKVFWAAPPTKANLATFVNWCDSKKQNEIFLGDIIDSPKCQMFILKEKETLLLPSGWIHAVYTPKDSLAFGGNFLHSFAIEQQLKIINIEKSIRIPKLYQISHRLELQWYVIMMYTCVMASKKMKNNSQFFNDELKPIINIDEVSKNLESILTNLPNSYMSRREHSNLCALVAAHNSLIDSQSNYSLPDEINDGKNLLCLCQKLLDEYDDKCFENHPQNVDPFLYGLKKILDSEHIVERPRRFSSLANSSLTSSSHSNQCNNNSNNSLRHSLIRRVRCKQCVACTSDDCQTCVYCIDMRKHGGPGKLKQSCLSRRCNFPKLPRHVLCMICNETQPKLPDDAFSKNLMEIIDHNLLDSPKASMLQECVQCYQICHPVCQLMTVLSNIAKHNGSNDTIRRYLDQLQTFDIDPEMPNTWVCLICTKDFDGKARYQSSNDVHCQDASSNHNLRNKSRIRAVQKDDISHQDLDIQWSSSIPKQSKSIEYQVNDEYTLVTLENPESPILNESSNSKSIKCDNDDHPPTTKYMKKKGVIEAYEMIHGPLDSDSIIFNPHDGSTTDRENSALSDHVSKLSQQDAI